MSAPAEDGKDQKSSTISLPAVPPEDARLHVVIQFRQRLDNRLAELMLLDVARKHPPPECQEIVDFPIAQLLAHFPAPSDRGYYSALQFRLQKEKENYENAQKRFYFEMKARTRLCSGLWKRARSKTRPT